MDGSLKEVETIRFKSLESGEGVAIVRAGHKTVAIGLSLASDGDVEVCISVADAERLSKAIQSAVMVANEK